MNLSPARSSMKIWWVIEIKGRFFGRCYATRAEIDGACGRCITIAGNRVNVWGRP